MTRELLEAQHGHRHAAMEPAEDRLGDHADDHVRPDDVPAAMEPAEDRPVDATPKSTLEDGMPQWSRPTISRKTGSRSRTHISCRCRNGAGREPTG